MKYDQKPDRRHDDVRAAYVDAAITIGRLISLNRAENMLVKQGFSSETIIRVLHNVGPHRPHRPATLPPVSLRDA